MSSKSTKQKKKWWAKLDEQEIHEALEDATVDAYDEYEQHAALMAVLEDELEFPFNARVLGEVVKVHDMEWPEDDMYGLDLICERNGERQMIDARSVDLVEPLPDGHLFLAAYLAWKRRW